MGSLISLSVDVSKIDKSKIVAGKKGKYINLTVSVNDDTDQYGRNVSCYHEQTKEQRDAKEQKTFLGNGKVFWTNGTVKTAEKTLGEFAKVAPSEPDTDDIDF
jgi:hypothetical protein